MTGGWAWGVLCVSGADVRIRQEEKQFLSIFIVEFPVGNFWTRTSPIRKESPAATRRSLHVTSLLFTSLLFISFHFTTSSGVERGITSQKVRFVGELLSPPAPGIALADQAHQKDTLFRVIPGSFQAPISGSRSGFPNPQEMMPTPTENIVLNAYFWKISYLSQN